MPAACRIAADLRQLAAAYGLSIDTESAGARGTQLTVVHDDGRIVLLHDDSSGTSAGGYRLDPGEVPAYLAAYARHPQLPSRCLADLVRQDPGAPGSLTLAGAREIAARHDLEIRIRRARGQAYITFCEPGTAGPPVLSYPAGTGTACHGPCTVPVAAINGYLLTYRVSVPAVMFTAPAAAPQDWARRVAQLTPHLVDGGGYFIRDTRDHLRAALTAARDGHTDEASRLLGQAETVTPPLTPAPERQAELLAVIGEQAARNGHTDDPAGYMARAMPPFLDASDREWDWVRIYIADHPDVRERTGRDGPVADAGQPDDSRQVAVGKSRQAKTALENGDYEQTLALLDEAELLYPDHGISWEAARDQVAARCDRRHPRDRRTRTACGQASRHRPVPWRKPRPRRRHGHPLRLRRRTGFPVTQVPPQRLMSPGPRSRTGGDGTPAASALAPQPVRRYRAPAIWTTRPSCARRCSPTASPGGSSAGRGCTPGVISAPWRRSPPSGTCWRAWTTARTPSLPPHHGHHQPRKPARAHPPGRALASPVLPPALPHQARHPPNRRRFRRPTATSRAPCATCTAGSSCNSSARCRNRAGREAGPGGMTATPVRAPARAWTGMPAVFASPSADQASAGTAS